MPHRVRPAVVAREIIRASDDGISTREVNEQLRARGITVKNLTTKLLRTPGIYCDQDEKGTKRIWHYGRRPSERGER